ncbi:sigma-70 family RNA polymerase sigma factor [Acinetobacter baumannii]|uniref:sigma-70 family RNA polymerase sigma factor n=1 Tax=Acinetobacter pittii TaxID=48296 RepID=UPI001F070281|nr:sigma-70 family RNA polymerase sigma factor [Acinetobacter pittii]MCH2054808.1 sigma-70 family RNA polymerase sigma factor [Acinetobacter pittii]MDV7452355.1 sigma-70 family RNA polymerase sigma factor [Acinetobacter baumannii]
MARPLRKASREGVLYTRRNIVECEIDELEKINAEEIVARSVIWPNSTAGFISSETLLYFIRNTNNSWFRENLLKTLLERIHRRLPKSHSLGGTSPSLMNMEICEKVVDDFIDLLLSDQASYDERLDYFEVNFNAALAKDRIDAQNKIQNKDNLTQGLYGEDDDILPEVENAIETYDPFDVDELDKEYYRRNLHESINDLSPLQQQIVLMWCHDIPITSKDPNEMTISKALNKSDKTIRNHRDSAFENLRKILENKDKLQ